MVAFNEMDTHVTMREQIAEGGGPVVLVNVFTVEPEEAERFLAVWMEDAAVMKRQPGFVSAQIHRGIAGSSTFLNHAVWESVEHFRHAFGSPEFQANLAHYPSSTVATPHLFRKEAVPGICVA